MRRPSLTTKYQSWFTQKKTKKAILKTTTATLHCGAVAAGVFTVLILLCLYRVTSSASVAGDECVPSRPIFLSTSIFCKCFTKFVIAMLYSIHIHLYTDPSNMSVLLTKKTRSFVPRCDTAAKSSATIF